ncbi:MAG: hypothetical protein ACRED5_08070 [Propylenella sp.]
MKWLLIVAVFSVGERSDTVFETHMETEELCDVAATKIKEEWQAAVMVATVVAFCIQISN